MNDIHSLSHSKWNCKYHIVFVPKYRRKVFYSTKRLEIGQILRQLCNWYGVTLLEAEACPDHIHMLVEIPPKHSVSFFMGYLKGKSSIMIDGEPYNAQSLRNLVNIFASKENFLFDMLQVSHQRETYCQKVDRDFLEKLNKQKPKTIEEIQKLWYRGDMNEVHHHYSSTRYKACNLHSFFANGHWEMRACNSSLHAGVIRSYVTLALAISNAALTKKFCSPHISESDNLRYSARVWLINLGLNGEEFRNCRKHLISHLDGCISWRHPEDIMNGDTPFEAPTEQYYSIIEQGYKENGLDTSYLETAFEEAVLAENIEFESKFGMEMF